MHSRRSTALSALALGASLFAACGGRYQTQREIDDDTVSSAGRAGSAPSRGGANNAGAPTGAGATAGMAATSGGGLTSFAGATSSAGASSGGACGLVDCAAPACPAGTMPVIPPGACCASCTSCGLCPAFECAPGFHFEMLAGNCCPTCVADADALCRKGQQAYAVQRANMLSKYQFGCASDNECVTVAPANACEQGCGYATVWYGVADSFESNLLNAAVMYCSSCKLGPIPPCVPPPSPRCISGSCQFAPK